jgi:hypothetical protein
MTKFELIEHLRHLDVAHREDGDGGYTLVREIRRWIKEVDKSAREVLWDILLELVYKQDRTLWGVALEVLIQENPPQTGEKLVTLLNKYNYNVEWKDQIVFALLRIKHFPSIAACISYIQVALDDKRRTILPLLAALCVLDKDACLKIASCYFGEVLKSAEIAEKHRGYIPSFIRNFMEVNEILISNLISRTRLIDNISAARLASMIDDYLALEAYQREMGREKIQALRKKISSV